MEPFTNEEIAAARASWAQRDDPAAAFGPYDGPPIDAVVHGAIKDLRDGWTWERVSAGITPQQIALMTPEQAKALAAARDRAKGRA